MPDDERERTLAALDTRLSEVEAVQELILRILSTTKPLSRVLEQYGATETQEGAFYRLLDDVAERAKGGERDRPTFGYFDMQMGDIFPSLRGDREFIALVIDMLKLDRPAYRELHAYAVEQNWPNWT